MRFSLSSRNSRRIFIAVTMVSVIVIVTAIINPMTTQIDNIKNLELKISRAQLITLLAILATLIAGSFTFIYRIRLNELQKKELLQLSTSLEKERIERLNLEEDISPRQIKNRDEWITKLSKYKGMTIIVQSIHEIEAMRFAERISSTFRDAQWKVVQQPADEILPYIDGILVEHQVGAFVGYQKINEITDMIVECFRKSGVEAVESPYSHDIPNTITIKVGFKPPIKDKGFKIRVINPK